MNAAAQALYLRLSEVERIKIRAATSEGAFLALYHNFKAELPGSNLHGGTEVEGIKAMKEVVAKVNEDFTRKSQALGF